MARLFKKFSFNNYSHFCRESPRSCPEETCSHVPALRYFVRRPLPSGLADALPV